MKRILFLSFIIFSLFITGCAKKKQPAQHLWFKDQNFIKSIQASDAEGIIGIIYTSNIDLNAINEDGQNALFYAILNTQNPKLISAIADSQRANLSFIDEYNNDALSLAARINPNEEVLLALLAAGAQTHDIKELELSAQRNTNLLISDIVKKTINKTPWFQNQKFLTAIRTGNFDLLKNEIPFTNMDMPDKAGLYPIMVAVTMPKKDILDLLIKKGQDINKTFTGDVSLLHYAAANITDLEIISLLVKAGAFINNQDVNGKTPLMNAINQNPNGGRIADFLIKNGADVNVTDKNGENVLHMAVLKTDNANLVNVLIKAGADVNAKNKNGDTPLLLTAAFNESDAILNALIKAKADINVLNKKGYSALMAAAMQNKNEHIVQTLIQEKADINQKTPEGFSPLVGAVSNNPNEKVAAALIRAGAAAEDKKTLLKYAAQNKNPAVKEIIDYYIPSEEVPLASNNAAAGAPDAQKKKTNTKSKKAWFNNDSFENAIKSGDTKALRMAIGSGVNIDVLYAGDRSITSLMFALAHSDNEAIIQTLIKEGAKVNVKNENGDTALLVAALVSKNPKVIETLIKAGADINAADNSGVTPLLAAVANNPSEAVIKALIQGGADTSNISALMAQAQKNKNPAIKQLVSSLK